MDKTILSWFSILKKRTWGGTLSRKKKNLREKPKNKNRYSKNELSKRRN